MAVDVAVALSVSMPVAMVVAAAMAVAVPMAAAETVAVGWGLGCSMLKNNVPRPPRQPDPSGDAPGWGMQEARLAVAMAAPVAVGMAGAEAVAMDVVHACGRN